MSAGWRFCFLLLTVVSRAADKTMLRFGEAAQFKLYVGSSSIGTPAACSLDGWQCNGLPQAASFIDRTLLYGCELHHGIMATTNACPEWTWIQNSRPKTSLVSETDDRACTSATSVLPCDSSQLPHEMERHCEASRGMMR